MLTNFDKYDMWVRGATCQELQHEKHAPHWIDGTQSSQQGFWCTGSHFPLIKQVYQENFFDIEIAAAQDLTNLLGLVKFCQDREIAFLIMFDSPVFRYSESQINDHCRNQIALTDIGLTESVMIDPLLHVLSTYILDQSGLIGFCIERDLPWYNSKYGPHPPSLSHYLYFQERILPWISGHYPNLDLARLGPMQLPMAEKMTSKWHKKEF
jgi:hypothetical protein